MWLFYSVKHIRLPLRPVPITIGNCIACVRAIRLLLHYCRHIIIFFLLRRSEQVLQVSFFDQEIVPIFLDLDDGTRSTVDDELT